jgi:hypothetical protein
MVLAKSRRLDMLRKAMPVWAAFALVGVAAALAAGPAEAILGEPSVSATVTPNNSTVDASGVNPVDTSFLVNFTGTSFLPQLHMMWINVSFSTDTGWKVNPTFANLTMSVDSRTSVTKNVAVTVTVPPKVSANNASVFSASFHQQNDIRFSQGQSGNATAQIHISQTFSTGAEFENGTAQLSLRQGGNANVSIRVSNRGNGDASYDAELRNAGDLRPSDIVLQGTTPATIALNGTGIVRMVIHANPQAIVGTYQLQIRVAATGAGTPPPAGAIADLTAQLLVLQSATQPPPTNNTTQPPPPSHNNTTTTPPPPPSNPDMIASLIGAISTPPGMIATGLLVAALLAVGFVWRRHTKAKRARMDALAKARQRRQGPGGLPPGPPGQGPPPSGAGLPRGTPVPGARPAGAVKPMRRAAVQGRPPSPTPPNVPPK